LWGAKGKKGKSPIKATTTEDMLFWATLGVIVGGRLGYVLLYDPAMFATPIQILKTWNGGMSFHGGMIGVSLAVVYVAWRKQIPLLRLADAIAPVAPIGLGLVRLANLINGELYGRPWDGPMAMSFPCDPSGPPPQSVIRSNIRRSGSIFDFASGYALFPLIGQTGANRWNIPYWIRSISYLGRKCPRAGC
jgi:prolipoprotein diacylglyceryl transferase